MPILNPISIANAADRIDPALVGEFDTSGLIMKDKIKVYDSGYKISREQKKYQI